MQITIHEFRCDVGYCTPVYRGNDPSGLYAKIAETCRLSWHENQWPNDVEPPLPASAKEIVETYFHSTDPDVSPYLHHEVFDVEVPLPETCCEFTPLTSLVPKAWEGWFYEAISDGAPFSWGDNDRSLILADRFLGHVETVVSYAAECGDIPMEEAKQFHDLLQTLGESYIDLES